MKAPVVIVHTGSQEYLQLAIRQLIHFGDEVYLLGDDSNKGLSQLNYHHINITKLSSSELESFNKSYKHYSFLDNVMVSFWIQRWFYILEFMRQNGISRVIHADSDILSFGNLNVEISERHKDFEFGCIITKNDNPFFPFKWNGSGHLSFWTIESISELCNFILGKYCKDDAVLIRKWNIHKDHSIAGGVCDMFLISQFYEHNIDKGVNLTEVYENRTNDVAIRSPKGSGKTMYFMEYSFVLWRELKKINFISKYPEVVSKENNKIVKFLTLHFQGKAKVLMHRYSLVLSEKEKRHYSKLETQTSLIELLKKIKSTITFWT